MAYKTLINPDTKEEYDDYLSSVGGSRPHEEEHIDPEEIERRKRERGKQRFMDDYDYANEEFFNMWKQRTQKKEQGGSKQH